MNSFVLDSINPYISCLREHLMEEQDLLNVILTAYSLSSSKFPKTYRKEECVFLLEWIKAVTKLVPHFTVQSRLWKFMQLN